MQRVENGGPVFYRFEQWRDADEVKHGVFTRLGGVSRAPWASLNVGGTVGDTLDAVKENLRRIYAALHVDGERACTVWQVHSADAVVVTGQTPGRRWLARADGMVTDVPGVPLTMRFADCVPILFFDPVRRAIGIAHAGWRGTVSGAAASTLRAMQAAFGSHPADVQAAIGPSIGPAHYQVGPEVVAAVEAAFGPDHGLIRRANDGSAYLDLWAANRLALERAGVRQIEAAEMCTASRVDEFFSHRAEHGKTGRFCAVISLRERSQ
ncbi:MAG: peptidoglycan editing factor PgeF [Anaerolineae bacterium]|nr:peptidoglycan editing factor PgeF [Anaerolineae bacterium]